MKSSKLYMYILIILRRRNFFHEYKYYPGFIAIRISNISMIHVVCTQCKKCRGNNKYRYIDFCIYQFAFNIAGSIVILYDILCVCLLCVCIHIIAFVRQLVKSRHLERYEKKASIQHINNMNRKDISRISELN